MSSVTAAMGFLSTGLNDIMAAKEVLGFCALFAFIVGFIYMFILKLCAATITWIFITLFNAIWLIGAAVMYLKSESTDT